MVPMVFLYNLVWWTIFVDALDPELWPFFIFGNFPCIPLLVQGRMIHAQLRLVLGSINCPFPFSSNWVTPPHLSSAPKPTIRKMATATCYSGHAIFWEPLFQDDDDDDDAENHCNL